MLALFWKKRNNSGYSVLEVPLELSNICNYTIISQYKKVQTTCYLPFKSIIYIPKVNNGFFSEVLVRGRLYDLSKNWIAGKRGFPSFL